MACPPLDVNLQPASHYETAVDGLRKSSEAAASVAADRLYLRSEMPCCRPTGLTQRGEYRKNRARAAVTVP